MVLTTMQTISLIESNFNFMIQFKLDMVLMLVGPTGGGKTSVYKVLSAGMSALANQGQAKVHLHILNPKSIKIPSQLYGDYN
jgi:flagellar biosynthesis GTPase FlhF